MTLNLFDKLPNVAESALHPKFKLLRDGLQFGAERDILLSWTDGFIDRDNKIVKEFQTTFHSSFWEFYLFKVFTDAGFNIDFSHDRPDFIINSPININIEAVVANIKQNGEAETNRNFENVLSMIVPVKYQEDFKILLDEAIVRNSSAILGKNAKFKDGYTQCNWVDPETPFVIALSSYDQIDYGREYYYPLLALLYGIYYDPKNDCYDTVTEVNKPGTTSTIPVGIFNDPSFEHISGILFSCTTTLGKLTSLANSTTEVNKQLNRVLNIKHDYEAPFFKPQIVNTFSPEEISEGLFFFHNPLAKFPVPSSLWEKTDCLKITFTPEGHHMSGNNLPIVSRINLPAYLLNETTINAIYNDYNK